MEAEGVDHIGRSQNLSARRGRAAAVERGLSSEHHRWDGELSKTLNRTQVHAHFFVGNALCAHTHDQNRFQNIELDHRTFHRSSSVTVSRERRGPSRGGPQRCGADGHRSRATECLNITAPSSVQNLSTQSGSHSVNARARRWLRSDAQVLRLSNPSSVFLTSTPLT